MPNKPTTLRESLIEDIKLLVLGKGTRLADIESLVDKHDKDLELKHTENIEDLKAEYHDQNMQWRETLLSKIEGKRKELWLDYHNAQKWSEQKAVAEALDEVINLITQEKL